MGNRRGRAYVNVDVCVGEGVVPARAGSVSFDIEPLQLQRDAGIRRENGVGRGAPGAVSRQIDRRDVDRNVTQGDSVRGSAEVHISVRIDVAETGVGDAGTGVG